MLRHDQNRTVTMMAAKIQIWILAICHVGVVVKEGQVKNMLLRQPKETIVLVRAKPQLKGRNRSQVLRPSQGLDLIQEREHLLLKRTITLLLRKSLGVFQNIPVKNDSDTANNVEEAELDCAGVENAG